MMETTKIFGATIQRQRERERGRETETKRGTETERDRESCPQRLPNVSAKLSKTQNCFKIAERFSERLL